MIREQYEKLAADLESTSYVSTSAYSFNWYREFTRIAEDQQMNITTEEQFMSQLKEVNKIHNIFITLNFFSLK